MEEAVKNQLDVWNFYESLADNFAGVVQYNKDNRVGGDITIDTVSTCLLFCQCLKFLVVYVDRFCSLTTFNLKICFCVLGFDFPSFSCFGIYTRFLVVNCRFVLV